MLGVQRVAVQGLRGAAYPGEKGSIHGLFSSRLGCETFAGVFDLTTLCVRDT
jgi:hypothetical protein